MYQTSQLLQNKGWELFFPQRLSHPVHGELLLTGSFRDGNVFALDWTDLIASAPNHMSVDEKKFDLQLENPINLNR